MRFIGPTFLLRPARCKRPRHASHKASRRFSFGATEGLTLIHSIIVTILTIITFPSPSSLYSINLRPPFPPSQST